MSSSELTSSNFEFKKASGFIKLSGRFISVNPNERWDSILTIAEDIAMNSKRLKIILDIEYISSMDIKYLFVLLKSVNALKNPSSVLSIVWKYESFDEDHMDLGMTLKSSLAGNVSFQFIESDTLLAA
jgi:hypothetical protein